ncbi:MAG: D-glycero-beta-D-manno-heptose 1-phosphate adenylyltransferase [Candidatus Omnitrophota bacterium]|nr:MAG: D-glycero-beta-D-manno-heptose 1-phosphate adenylyltransferase [Candidatus Omnitrophota bacterium]
MIKDKIKSLNCLIKIVLNLKQKNKKIVFTNGCFDLLHYGHVDYLEQAKKNGDILLVGLNSDLSVTKIKGSGRPINNQDARAYLVAALQSVDYVVIFNASTPLDIIMKLEPDVLVKGADWKAEEIVGSDYVKACGGRVAQIDFVKGYSTTNLVKKIVKKNS